MFACSQDRITEEREHMMLTGVRTSRTGSFGSSQRRAQNEGTEPDVNGEWLLQLMDMGFSRERCIEALLHTPSVEQATDYLLSNPSPFPCCSHPTAVCITSRC